MDDPILARIDELCLAADERGIEALTARQQLVVHAWSARGIIGNGGFQYFLQGDRPLASISEAFRALGFEDAAIACERVREKVASAAGVGERARRDAVIHDSRKNGALDTEDGAVFEVGGDEMRAAIGRYMRSNPRDFPGLAASGGGSPP